MLFWQLAGMALLVRHGVTTRRILEDRELTDRRVQNRAPDSGEHSAAVD
jgi:hypothetical protein